MLPQTPTHRCTRLLRDPTGTSRNFQDGLIPGHRCTCPGNTSLHLFPKSGRKMCGQGDRWWLVGGKGPLVSCKRPDSGNEPVRRERPGDWAREDWPGPAGRHRLLLSRAAMGGQGWAWPLSCACSPAEGHSSRALWPPRPQLQWQQLVARLPSSREMRPEDTWWEGASRSCLHSADVLWSLGLHKAQPSHLPRHFSLFCAEETPRLPGSGLFPTGPQVLFPSLFPKHIVCSHAFWISCSRVF